MKYFSLLGLVAARTDYKCGIDFYWYKATFVDEVEDKYKDIENSEDQTESECKVMCEDYIGEDRDNHYCC